jgi:hypothetical protein
MGTASDAFRTSRREGMANHTSVRILRHPAAVTRNPLHDEVGFVVHMGELLDGKPTNHLDLEKKIARTKARDAVCVRCRRGGSC